MSKILILNGSPHPEGHTAAALQSVGEMLSAHGDELHITQIPVDIKGCRDCGNCHPRCEIDNAFRKIVDYIESAEIIVLGTPVYLDMPTPQVVALLTRLNCMAEPTGRIFFRGKKVYLVATSYCSGTKAAINVMRGACEMLGLDIPGRSSYEYVQRWDDKKIRGGYAEHSVWLGDKPTD